MNCPNCGRQVGDGSAFCPGCGAGIPAQPAAPEAPAQAAYKPPVQQSAPSYQPPMQQSAPTYQPPMQQANGVNLAPVGIGQWIGVFILAAIPVVNLIMLIVWAASSGAKKSLRNYAAAMLIVMAIAVVLSVIAGVILASIGYTITDTLF